MKNSVVTRQITVWVAVIFMSGSCQQNKTVPNISDVEIIFNYILKNDFQPNQEKKIPFEIAMQSQNSANVDRVIRAHRIVNALALEDEPEIRNHLDVDCLASPNTSIEINLLREKVSLLRKEIDKNGNKRIPVMLLFSSSCVTADGRHYYYVELTAKRDRYVSGDLYILNKGVVERVINIWIT